jgi:hypothetical protein
VPYQKLYSKVGGFAPREDNPQTEQHSSDQQKVLLVEALLKTLWEHFLEQGLSLPAVPECRQQYLELGQSRRSRLGLRLPDQQFCAVGRV